MGRPAFISHRPDLARSVVDGVMYSVMVGLGELFIPPFVHALDLGDAATGLVATLPPVAGAVLQLVSPRGVARLASHKRWVIACVIVQVLSFVPLIFVALTSGSVSWPAWAVFAFVTLYWAPGQAAGAAWNTWIGTRVPHRIRSRYFGQRARWLQGGQLAGFVAGGAIMEYFRAGPWSVKGFAILFAGALLARLVCVRALTLTSEPVPMPTGQRHVSVREMLGAKRHSTDLRVLSYMLAVTFAMNISSPHLYAYVLTHLHASYVQYTAVFGIIMLSKIVALPFLSRYAHRHGTRRLLILSALAIIPIAPLWGVESITFLVCLQVVSGVLWGGYELSTLLMFFMHLSPEERTSIGAKYQLANALAIASGSVVGQAILDRFGTTSHGYMTVFIVSSAGRVAALALLAMVLRDPLAGRLPAEQRV